MGSLEAWIVHLVVRGRGEDTHSEESRLDFESGESHRTEVDCVYVIWMIVLTAVVESGSGTRAPCLPDAYLVCPQIRLEDAKKTVALSFLHGGTRQASRHCHTSLLTLSFFAQRGLVRARPLLLIKEWRQNTRHYSNTVQ